MQGRDVLSIEGEVPGKENLSQLDAAMRHEEAVQRHIEEGRLAPAEIALYILHHGSTGQKVSMIQHFNRTLKDSEDKARISQFCNELNEALWSQDPEFQLATPPALGQCLPLFTEQQVLLLLTGLKTMLDVRSEPVRRAWSTFALEIVNFISPQDLVRDVVPLALKKGDHSEPHDQRVFSCTLMGRLCRRLDANTIVSTILNRAINMCQDTETSVRVAMCEQLGEVARAIGLALAKEKVTAELFELLVDEEKLVSRAAFTALIDLVEFFDPPYRREHFYPIIKSYISAPPEEVLSLLIEEFGRFLWKIKSDIQCTEDITLFANFFRQSAQKPDPEVRRMCAFNFPAVVASLPISVYPTHLSQTAKSLAVDSHPPVRRAVAAGMFELCPILGDKAAFYLKDSFLSLIADGSLEVRSVAVQNLQQLLDCFAAQLKGDERDTFFRAVAPHIISYEQQINKDWRKVSTLLNAFVHFPNYFPGQTLHSKFLPLLMKHLVGGASAIKDQCASLVVLFTKNMGDNLLVVEVFSKIVADFGKSSSCFNRATFALLFRHCANAYSRRFLRVRLLETCMDLAKDSVPNVRLQLVKCLPEVRRCLKAPVEAEYATMYNAGLERLKNDSCAEVLQLLSEVTEQIEEIEKEFARQSAMRQTAQDDIIDRQFEESEGNLLEVAKEQEKIERRQKVFEMLNSEPALSAGARPPGKTTGTKRVTGASTSGAGKGPVRPGGKAVGARPGVGRKI